MIKHGSLKKKLKKTPNTIPMYHPLFWGCMIHFCCHKMVVFWVVCWWNPMRPPWGLRKIEQVSVIKHGFSGKSVIYIYGSVSKPCTPGEHQNSWYMDVHPPKNGINRYWSIPIYIYILVGGFNPSEKYESQLGLLFPTYGKIKFMFQTINQYSHLFMMFL